MIRHLFAVAAERVVRTDDHDALVSRHHFHRYDVLLRREQLAAFAPITF